MAFEPIVLNRQSSRSDTKTTGSENTPELFVGRSSDDDDIDGMELSKAARHLGVSIDEIWRRVRNGKLVARTDRGQVMVYTDASTVVTMEGLPPLPNSTAREWTKSASNSDDSKLVDTEYNQISVLSERVSSSDRQEVALLIDHLSLAKEENREILRLTHESMSRLSEMTDKMLDMKDSIISSKDEQMQILKQRLAEQTEQLRQVLREKEDLETLTEALQKS
jgi:hypothetical protein